MFLILAELFGCDLELLLVSLGFEGYNLLFHGGHPSLSEDPDVTAEAPEECNQINPEVRDTQLPSPRKSLFGPWAKICIVPRKELFQPRKTQGAELALDPRWLVTLDRSPGTSRCVQQHSQPPGSNAPGANSLQAAQQEPQKTGTSTTLPLQEKEGCSSNLNNCCQAFSSDSLVSETGSLASRALSGDPPCPVLPRHLDQRDSLHLLLLLPLAFCFPKQPWLGRAPQPCGHRHMHKADRTPKELCSAMDP